jgi:hypothetical protein
VGCGQAGAGEGDCDADGDGDGAEHDADTSPEVLEAGDCALAPGRREREGKRLQLRHDDGARKRDHREPDHQRHQRVRPLTAVAGLLLAGSDVGCWQRRRALREGTSLATCNTIGRGTCRSTKALLATRFGQQSKEAAHVRDVVDEGESP